MKHTKIEWNKVTWYSKLVAVIVFIATFIIAFNLGILTEKAAVEHAIIEAPSDVSSGGTTGAHCGGFIRNAPTCASGYHCELQPSRPDTGGTCVKN